MTVQEGDQVQRPHAKRSFPMAMDFEYLDEYELNEYKLFLKRRICNIGTLRANMGHANFIAMDTEHGQGFSSIGLAFATKLEPIEHAICPVAMADALGLATGQPEGAPRETAKADSICFNIRGFERSQPARERIWGPPDQDIEFEAVASKVTGFVQRCKEAEPEKPLTLVTYSSRAELSAIASLFPQLYGLFSNWVDLQPLVLEAYHRQTDYTRLDGLRFSLRYAMKTLGFSTGYQPSSNHHAGNDALRTLAIMMSLTYENVECRRLKELEHVLRVNAYRKEQHRLKGTEKHRGLCSKRPGPPSWYPHVAKITMAPTPGSGEQQGTGHQFAAAAEEQEGQGQLYLPPVDASIYRPDQTWDFFSPYEPSAIGRA